MKDWPATVDRAANEAAVAALGRLELVAAVAANGTIGRSGQLPWHLPDDLKHFKALTLGHAMLMGRRTWESVGKPLPGRRTIIVSGTLAGIPFPGVELAPSLETAAILAAKCPEQRAFVVGGTGLYTAALRTARAMHLTELDSMVDGDTWFPQWSRADWRVETETFHPADDRHAFGFWMRKYVR